MKLAILWTFRTDYLMAALLAASKRGHEVLLILQDDDPNLPQREPDRTVRIVQNPSRADLIRELAEFAPDVSVVAGWHIADYREACGFLEGKSERVMAFDNQWRATPRQLMGAAAFKVRLRRLFDWALVPGERQYTFARRMGFEPDRIHYGSIPANTELFETEVGRSREPAFISVSRLVSVKGITDLLEAYSIYRRSVARPWSLRVVGTGPVRVDAEPGVIPLGFLEADQTAVEMKKASCFVLASRFEPWGVVLHEAATAGLPIIATEECGASGVFVLTGVNGVLVPSSRPEAMAKAMIDIASADAAQWESLSRAGRELSRRSSPLLWTSSIEMLLGRAQLR